MTRRPELDAARARLGARHDAAEAALAVAVWKAMRLYLRDVRTLVLRGALTAAAGVADLDFAEARAYSERRRGGVDVVLAHSLALLAAGEEEDGEAATATGSSSADAGGASQLLPDLSRIAQADQVWTQLTGAHIVPAVDKLLGEVFAATLADPNTASVRGWQEQYLSTVPNQVKGVTNEVFDDLRTELQVGIDKGQSIPEIRDGMAKVLSTASGGAENVWRARATRIARTEATRALNGGQAAAWQFRDALLGTTTDKIWVATIDNRTRPSHLAADGQQVHLDQPFQLMGGPVMYPGDPTASASETVNCRCAMVEVETGDSGPVVSDSDRQLGGGRRNNVTSRGGFGEAAADDGEALADDAGAVEGGDEGGDDEGPDDGGGAGGAPAEEVGAVSGSDGDGAGEGSSSGPAEESTDPAPEAEAEATAAAQRAVDAKAMDAASQVLGDGVDEAGYPLRLTYDYLSGLSEDELDALTDHLSAGVAEDDPLDGARFDDLDRYLEYQAREDELVDDLSRAHASDAEITRAVDELARENGVPGLTHPSVGGAGKLTGIPSRAQVQDEYSQFLYTEWLRAEADTRGVMVNARGERLGKTGFDMFSSKRGVADVMQYASDEMLDWFEANGRVSWAEYYYGRTGAPAFAERAAKAQQLNARINRDRTALSAAAGLPPAPIAAAVAASAPFAAGKVTAPSPAQLTAYRGGRAAFRSGRAAATCPYTAADAEGLQLLWVRGFLFARRDERAQQQRAAGLLGRAPRTTGPAGAGSPTHAVTAAGGDAPMTQTWSGLLAPIGVNSGDGRRLAQGGKFTFRPLPLPLMFQDSSAMGHDQSVVVGRITEVVVLTEAQDEFIPGLYGKGDYLDGDEFADDVAKAIALVDAGLGHVSVDLAEVTAELVDADGKPISEDDLYKAWEEGQTIDVYDQFSAASLIGTTQVAKPAFAEAIIQLGDAGCPDAPAADPAADGDDATSTDGDTDSDAGAPAAGGAAEAAIAEAALLDAAGTEITVGARVAVMVGEGDGDGDSDPEADPQADPGDATDPQNGVDAGADPDGDGDDDSDPSTDTDDDAVQGTVTAIDEANDAVTVQPDDDELQPMVVPSAQVTVLTGDDSDDDGTPDAEDDDQGGGAPPAPSPTAALSPAQQVASLQASAALVEVVRPDPELFANPELAGPTPLTVGPADKQGVRRVYGHVATWGQCHIGYANKCVTPPQEASYDYFHVGAVELSDGTELAVGNVTLGGRHADPTLAYRDAIAHYDDAGAGVAAVRAYADEFGIAVAGYITPGTSEAQVAELKRTVLSGDWRRVGGEMRMCGALAVNTGGFPVPRYAVDANGRQLSLVAAGGVPQSVREPESYEQVARRVFAEERAKERRREAVRALALQAAQHARRDAIAGLLTRSQRVDSNRSAIAALAGQVR